MPDGVRLPAVLPYPADSWRLTSDDEAGMPAWPTMIMIYADPNYRDVVDGQPVYAWCVLCHATDGAGGRICGPTVSLATVWRNALQHFASRHTADSRPGYTPEDLSSECQEPSGE
jgi:hypothetical protein